MKGIRITINFSIILVMLVMGVFTLGSKSVNASVEPIRKEKIYLFKSEFLKIDMDATYKRVLSDSTGSKPVSSKTYKDGTKSICKAELSGSNNRTLKITAVADSGSADVYVWNDKCTKCFRKITVYIIPSPSITFDQQSIYLWEGKSREINASISVTAKSVEYTWQTGSKSLLNVVGNKSKCKVEAIKPEKNEVVSVICKAKVYSSKGSKEITKTINAYLYPNTQITNTNLTVTSWIGDVVELTLETKGNVGEYIWKVKDNNISQSVIYDTDKKTVKIKTDEFSKNTEFKLIAMAKYTCLAGTQAITKEFKINLYKKPTLLNLNNEFYNSGSVQSRDVYLYEGQSAWIEMNTDGTVNGYSWSSKDNTGIIIDNTSEKRCKIKAVKQGVYTVSGNCWYKYSEINLPDMKSTSKSIKVTVIKKPEILLYNKDTEIKELTLYEGETVNVSCMINNIGNNDNVSRINATSTFPDLVKIQSKENEIEIKGIGSTFDNPVKLKIEAEIESDVSKNNGKKYGAFEKELIVNVISETKVPVMAVEFENKEKSSIVGKALKFEAMVYPYNATVKTVLYKSDNPSVIEINEKGYAVCKKCGQATITALSADDTSVKKDYRIKVVCDTPKNVRTVNDNGHSMLIWDVTEYAAQYTVYRSVDGGEYKRLAIVNTNSYVDLSTIYGSRYDYKVVAMPREGEEFSSGTSKKTQFYLKVPKVSGISVSNKQNEIVLKWNKIGNASYEIYRSENKNCGYIKITVTKEKEYKDTNIICGKKYYYKIKTVLKGKSSDFSKVKCIRHRLLKPVVKYVTFSDNTLKIKVKKYMYDGYIVYIGKNSKNKKAIAEIKSNKANIYTGNYTGSYGVWIRAYKTVNGKKVYSGLSKSKTICI